jgi:hypothetical protein
MRSSKGRRSIRGPSNISRGVNNHRDVTNCRYTARAGTPAKAASLATLQVSYKKVEVLLFYGCLEDACMDQCIVRERV